MKKSNQFKMGVIIGGVLTGIGLTALAAIRRRQREEIYHEAELKALDELDDLMVDSCGGCCCSEECHAAEEEDGLPTEENQPAIPADYEDPLL